MGIANIDTRQLPVENWLKHTQEVAPKKIERKLWRSGELDEQSLTLTGLLNTGSHFRYVCPTCGKTEVTDQRMEPACTGPSWTDDHPLEPMILLPE